MRQRRHSPCVSGPPQVGQVSVNAIDLLNSGRGSKSMPRLITPAPSPPELQVSLPLLLDLAPSARCRQRMALTPQAIPLFLPPQMHFANAARPVSRYSKPTSDHNRANR